MFTTKVVTILSVLGVMAMTESAVLDPVWAAPPSEKNLDSLALGSGELPFSGVIMVAKNGNVVASRSVGYANVEFEVPTDLQTRYKLHSLSKPLLSVVAMRAVEAGKLKLDVSASVYLANWPAAWNAVTAEHLLSHSSGIPDIAEMFLSEWAGDLAKTWEKVSAGAAKMEVQFQPGKGWQYCNAGYVVVACILERVYGASIAEVFERELFRPAKMSNAGLEATPNWATASYDGSPVVARLASGYNGGPGTMQVANSKMYAIPGAGGVYATAGDLAAFAHTVFAGGLISEESIRVMTTVPPDRRTPYAMGWVVTNRDGRKVYRHDGGTNGFVTSLEYYPESKLSIIILSNFGFAKMGEIRSQIAEAVFGT